MTGEIHVATREIGYCAQDPWLPNYTIKQNITSFYDFDGPWYRTVVRACALDEDIGQFAASDDTLVGSKGVSLSGGQKQRLALARALYARNRILLLDDILSGLDKNTEVAVFQRVLGRGGLCHKHGITVILVTHAVKYLPYADHVVVFDGNGSISEQGPPKQVASQDQLMRAITLQDNGANKEASVSKASPPERNKTKSQDKQAASTRSAGDLKIYAYYINAVGWVLVFYVCVEVITTFLMRFPDVWLRWWSASEISLPGQRTNFFWGYTACLLVSPFLVWSFQYWLSLLGLCRDRVLDYINGC